MNIRFDQRSREFTPPTQLGNRRDASANLGQNRSQFIDFRDSSQYGRSKKGSFVDTSKHTRENESNKLNVEYL